MNTIHISNIGGQPLPVLQGMIEFPADQTLLLHSQESKTIADKIKSAMKGNILLHLIENPNDFYSILSICNEISDRYPASKFHVNISGGTKIMSLGLFAFFSKRPEDKVFHIDQNGIVHFLTKEESQPLRNFLPIINYIEFSGQKIKSMVRYEEIPPESWECEKVIRGFFEKSDGEYLQLCKEHFRYKKIEKGFSSIELENPRSGSTLQWINESQQLIFTLYHKYKPTPDVFCFEGKDSVGIALEAKWFELFVAQILSRWEKTRELVWALVVPYNNGEDKNEIDIIVNTGIKLLFVECKTQINDIKDVDKFRNVTKNYGGLGAKSILITYSKPPTRFIEKCVDNNILHFYFRDGNREVRVADDLFQMLDSEMVKTNTF